MLFLYGYIFKIDLFILLGIYSYIFTFAISLGSLLYVY